VEEPDAASAQQAETLAGVSADDLAVLQHWRVLQSGFRRLTTLLLTDVEAKVGVAPSSLQVLCLLLEAPQRAAPMYQLAQTLGFSTAGATKVADRLTEAGLIERRTCPSDRRMVYATLTERGLEVATAGASALAEALAKRVIEPLGAGQFESISAAIGSLGSNVA
jgi:DNA-binding MarR family transcriptional regulator